MDVNVSEKTENRIRELADKTGQDAADFAGSLLDEAVQDRAVTSQKGRKSLSDLTGMFYGGPGDTSERASEILRAEMGLSSLGGD
jgi:hypothetical protein